MKKPAKKYKLIFISFEDHFRAKKYDFKQRNGILAMFVVGWLVDENSKYYYICPFMNEYGPHYDTSDVYGIRKHKSMKVKHLTSAR